jgi:hypothetical protein
VALKSQPLATCVSCHGEFENPAVVAQKRSVMIDKILRDQMPPGDILNQYQKGLLIEDIRQVVMIAQKTQTKSKSKAKAKSKSKTKIKK